MTVDPKLSAKRRRAGRAGAAKRWAAAARRDKPSIPSALVTDVWAHLHNRDERLAAKRPKPRARALRVVNEDEDAAGGTASVYLYDEIGFWGITASDFLNALSAIDADVIDLHINSPGGDVFDGIAIYNALADHPATVNVVVDSLAASAASFIAMAGDKVRMNRASQVMIHDALGICIGNASDMQTMKDLLDRVSDTIAGIYAARAGETEEFWREQMLAETWYSGAEAVEAGLADEMVAGKAKNADPDEDTDTDGDEDADESEGDDDTKSEEEPADADEDGDGEDDDPDEDDDDEKPAARYDGNVVQFKHRGRAQAPAPTIHKPAAPAAITANAGGVDVAKLQAALKGALL